MYILNFFSVKQTPEILTWVLNGLCHELCVCKFLQSVITMLADVHLLTGSITMDSVTMSKIELWLGSKQRFLFSLFFRFRSYYILRKYSIFVFIGKNLAAFLWVTMRTPCHFFGSQRNGPRSNESSTSSRHIRSWYVHSFWKLLMFYFTICIVSLLLFQ